MSSFTNKFRHNLKFGKRDMMACVFIVVFYVFIVVFYVFAGLIKGFIGGAIIGVIIAAIYQAGSLTMSTWIPLTWAMIQVLYDIVSSYLTSQIIL